MKDITDTARSASYLGLYIDIGSEDRLRMKLYDKIDDFNFPIVNFPCILSSIFKQHLHMGYISLMTSISELVVQLHHNCHNLQELTQSGQSLYVIVTEDWLAQNRDIMCQSGHHVYPWTVVSVS